MTKPNTRRGLLRALGGGSVAAVSVWTTPIVKTVILPAHAQTSAAPYRLAGSADVADTSTSQSNSNVQGLDGRCVGGSDLTNITATVNPEPPDGTIIKLTFSESAVPVSDGASGSLPPGSTPVRQKEGTVGGVASFENVDLCSGTNVFPSPAGDYTLKFKFEDQDTFGTDVSRLSFRLIE